MLNGVHSLQEPGKGHQVSTISKDQLYQEYIKNVNVNQVLYLGFYGLNFKSLSIFIKTILTIILIYIFLLGIKQSLDFPLEDK